MLHWTPQEDEELLQLFEETDAYNRWKEISNRMNRKGFNKTQLQCRNRYQNKLNPTLNLGKWDPEQLRKLFRFYDQYGSKWNLIQAFLPTRTQNSIKNRFFSTLKSLLRKLFKHFEHPEFETKIKKISSREITDLYEGRNKFRKFRGIISKILEMMNFQIGIKDVDHIIQEHEEALKQMCLQVCGSKLLPKNSSENSDQNVMGNQKNKPNIPSQSLNNEHRNTDSSEKSPIVQQTQTQQVPNLPSAYIIPTQTLYPNCINLGQYVQLPMQCYFGIWQV